VSALEAALSVIPERRDTLNTIDDYLSRAIRHVETVLRAGLKVSTPCETTYDTEHGRYVLGYGKWNGQWQLTWGSEDDNTKDTPLLSAPRAVRAEVFTPEPTGTSPMERLLTQTAESLSRYATERTPQLAMAEQLLKVLADVGFPLVP
jgi:hypothetical protein